MGVINGIRWDLEDEVIIRDTSHVHDNGTVSLRLGCSVYGRDRGGISVTGHPLHLLEAGLRIAEVALAHDRSPTDRADHEQTAQLADDLASLIGQLLATVNRDDVEPALAMNIERNLGVAAEQWARQASPRIPTVGEVADADTEG